MPRPLCSQTIDLVTSSWVFAASLSNNLAASSSSSSSCNSDHVVVVAEVGMRRRPPLPLGGGGLRRSEGDAVRCQVCTCVINLAKTL